MVVAEPVKRLTETEYLELERRAVESANTADVELLQTFQRTWNTLASELR